MSHSLDLALLRRANVARQAAYRNAKGETVDCSQWSLEDWFCSTLGELGEASNIAKKLNRVRDGILGNKESEPELRAALADEIADTFIYLDLLAQSQGISLEAAVVDKFNRTSAKIGYENTLFNRSA